MIDGKRNGNKIQWPYKKDIAVMLTFDFDAEFLRISRAKSKGKKIGFTDYSRGQYGPDEGILRCLNILDLYDVKGTFFVPGIVAEKYRDKVKEIYNRGHEIGYHGYMHESVIGIDINEEKANMDKSEEILKSITGKRPVGHRAPESIMHPFTIDLISERGYLYSSSMKDCDYAYIYQNGIVEFPNDITMDDFTYFYFTFSEPAVRSMYTNSEVIKNWKLEFDGLKEEKDKIFVLKLHPQLIGRASRIAAFGEFISYMKQRNAWIATCEEVAKYVLAQKEVKIDD